jgi:hypothetical protein
MHLLGGGCLGGTDLAESCLHVKKILNLKLAEYLVMGDVYSEAPCCVNRGSSASTSAFFVKSSDLI